MFHTKITEHSLAEMCRELKTTFNQAQGDAARIIVKECDAQGVPDMRMIAYVLGTVYNECRFKSIPEKRAKTGTDVWKLQERYWHTGYYGRGYSQLTWKKNYEKFSAILGIDLVTKPDRVLEPEIGAKIIVNGMLNGLFTGRKLSTYFNDMVCDWMGARSIVNGKLPGQRYGFMAKECAEASKIIYGILCRY